MGEAKSIVSGVVGLAGATLGGKRKSKGSVKWRENPRGRSGSEEKTLEAIENLL